MTNLAITTLALLVLAFPGYILRASYYAGKFTRHVLPRNWTDDLAKAILYSLPLHVLVIGVFQWLHDNGRIHTTLDFQTVARIVSGQYEGNFVGDIERLYANTRFLVWYYVLILAIAIALGSASRWIVWRGNWDVRLPWLRYNNEWLYTLMGRDVNIPKDYEGGKVYVRVEALTKIPMEEGTGKMRLYRGFVEGFTTEENGTLRDILITDAERGNFRKEPAKEPEFYWKPIKPGNLVVLKYSELQNLNISYLIDVPPASPSEKTASRESSPRA